MSDTDHKEQSKHDPDAPELSFTKKHDVDFALAFGAPPPWFLTKDTVMKSVNIPEPHPDEIDWDRVEDPQLFGRMKGYSESKIIGGNLPIEMRDYCVEFGYDFMMCMRKWPADYITQQGRRCGKYKVLWDKCGEADQVRKTRLYRKRKQEELGFQLGKLKDPDFKPRPFTDPNQFYQGEFDPRLDPTYRAFLKKQPGVAPKKYWDEMTDKEKKEYEWQRANRIPRYSDYTRKD
eukprot:104097_1